MGINLQPPKVASTLVLVLVLSICTLQTKGQCLTCSVVGKLAAALANASVETTTCVKCEGVTLRTEELAVSGLNAFTRLTHLSLAQNDLVSLSADVLGFLLPIAGKMEIFNISKNDIVGTVPNELPLAFSNLEALDLSDAGKISGTIPNSIGLMGSLKSLKFGNNKFIGTIPNTFDALLSLRELELNDNRLTGTVPDISRMTLLTRLRIAGNDFIGTLPKHSAEDTDLPGGHVFSPIEELDLQFILLCVGGVFVGIFIIVLVIRYRNLEHHINRVRRGIPVAGGGPSWMDDQSSLAGLNVTPAFAAKPVYSPPSPVQGFSPAPFGQRFGPPSNGSSQGYSSEYSNGYNGRNPGLSGFSRGSPPAHSRKMNSPPPPPPAVHGNNKFPGLAPPPGLFSSTLKRAKNKAGMLKNQSTAWFSTKYPGPKA